MKPKVGERLVCAACGVQVIVVRAPADELELSCDGRGLLAGADRPPSRGGSVDAEAGTRLGKRYVDEASGLELLCTSSGTGTLEVGGAPMRIKQAKSLPSSD